MPAVSHGFLVSFATLYGYRFRFPSKHASNEQSDMPTERSTSEGAKLMCSRYSCYVYTRVEAVYLALVLSPIHG